MIRKIMQQTAGKIAPKWEKSFSERFRSVLEKSRYAATPSRNDIAANNSSVPDGEAIDRLRDDFMFTKITPQIIADVLG